MNIITILYLFVLPLFLGLLFYERDEGRLFIIVKGYLVQWAVFFVVSIPCIVLGKSLTFVLNIFTPAIIVTALLAIGLLGYRAYNFKKRESKELFCVKPQPLSPNELIYLALFIGVVLFQLYKTVFYAFTDGDDSYYVAIANSINVSDKLYTVDAYTGETTTINYRYAFAPFSAWIAALARVTGTHVSTMSHVYINVTLILITYVIYNELGKIMFKGNREKRYMFLVLLAVFAMFANVSQSMPGTFMLTRARQGKEALSNIILPFFFYSFYKKSLAESFRVKFFDCCLWIVLILAGALTSVFSNVLLLIAMGIVFLYSLYKKSDLKSKMYIISASLPTVFVILLYWRMG